MTSTAVADAFATLTPFLTARQFDADALNRFTEACDRIRAALDQAERVELADRLRDRAPTGDTIRLHSVLFHLTGDLYDYERILHYLHLGRDSVSPALMHYVYWCMTRQVFLGAALSGKAAAFGPCDLFRFYEALVDAVAVRWGIVPSRRAPRPGPVRRVVLVTNQFLGTRHQPSRDVFDFAHRLGAEGGLDAMIVNANLMPLRVEALFIPPLVATVEDRYEGAANIEMWGRTVRMASFTGRAFDEAKLHAVTGCIDELDPDVVIAFGGNNLAADLYARAGARPVVCVPTTSGLTTSLAHLVLGFDDKDPTAGLSPLYRAPFAARFRPFSFGYTLPPTDGAAAVPDPGEASFLFAVVGTRLDHEADPAFLGLVEAILDRCPGAAVAFAGEAPELAGRLAASRHAGRLRALGHVDDIRALYARCGALLNPPRQGGGGSAAIAMADGVPVVTTAFGDVAGVAGPDMAVPDAAAYVERAAALFADPAFRADRAALARRRFADTVDRRHSVARLLSYCEEAHAMMAGDAP
ncbi:glycosyltransferase [Azospirillum halopraeferens]|uniref:glycosyltransferase n=1 Tax=Azospirillum halopraeferens TaxID=34010 RepID=UPI000419F1F5|nr:glycosyltransferase [Azospirillum halopraeferens]